MYILFIFILLYFFYVNFREEEEKKNEKIFINLIIFIEKIKRIIQICNNYKKKKIFNFLKNLNF
jgi:hypothetical protein